MLQSVYISYMYKVQSPVDLPTILVCLYQFNLYRTRIHSTLHRQIVELSLQLRVCGKKQNLKMEQPASIIPPCNNPTLQLRVLNPGAESRSGAKWLLGRFGLMLV